MLILKTRMSMTISILPKYSVGQVMGFLKGKTAIHIARVYPGRGYTPTKIGAGGGTRTHTTF
jgi:hypothetical protein